MKNGSQHYSNNGNETITRKSVVVFYGGIISTLVFVRYILRHSPYVHTMNVEGTHNNRGRNQEWGNHTFVFRLFAITLEAAWSSVHDLCHMNSFQSSDCCKMRSKHHPKNIPSTITIMHKYEWKENSSKNTKLTIVCKPQMWNHQMETARFGGRSVYVFHEPSLNNDINR